MTDNEIADANRYGLQMAKNLDRGMVKDAAREVGLSGNQLEKFQREIESLKRMSGKRNDTNFSYSELVDIAEDIKDTYKP